MLLLLCLCVLTLRAYGETLSYSFIFSRAIRAPDGYNRSVVVINNEFPGPFLFARVGDLLIVNVTNNLPPMEVLDLHFHGFAQGYSGWMDGGMDVTNCPIASGNSYSYHIQAITAGTFFYHRHDSADEVEGGYGIVAIEESTPLSGVDGERTLTISDWYHQSAAYIREGLVQYGPMTTSSPPSGFIWPGNGQSILVNGRGKQNITIDVEQGKSYRFRVVNVAALAYFNVAIAGHNLTVVSYGSMPTRPVSLLSLDLAASQRFDFIVHCNQPQRAMYRMQIITNWRGTDNTPAGVFNSIFLRYNNSTRISPLVPLNQNKSWNGQISVIRPAISEIVPIPPSTRQLFFNNAQQYVSASSFRGLDTTGADTSGYLRWTVNNQSYLLGNTPLLLASFYNLLYRVSNATKPIRVALNEVVDVILQNRVALNGVCETHPWHLHGYRFWILATGDGEFSPSDESLFNTIDPVYADTVVNYATSYGQTRGGSSSKSPQNAYKACGWTAIRFVANNPGLWDL